jgi:2-polyprenyl-3-methyl-5-hydroxy-6-metoxy-1,4-benzoquinol methylase
VNAILTEGERAEARAHLVREYEGVFTDAEIVFHLNAHVGDGFADYACQVVATATVAGSRVLDVGAGFGSFVLLARERGFDAIGTEIAPFEVNFARQRLARIRPNDNPTAVYLDGPIEQPALNDRRFDVITIWNVLEHVLDDRSLLQRAAALLNPGGTIYVLCPNYAAWRLEAHYHVPWHPFLTRAAAVERLRQYGKDPRFFETSIFRRTNWGVMRELRRAGLVLHDRLNTRPMTTGAVLGGELWRHPAQVVDFFNPFRSSVEVAARKPASNGR